MARQVKLDDLIDVLENYRVEHGNLEICVSKSGEVYWMGDEDLDFGFGIIYDDDDVPFLDINL